MELSLYGILMWLKYGLLLIYLLSDAFTRQQPPCCSGDLSAKTRSQSIITEEVTSRPNNTNYPWHHWWDGPMIMALDLHAELAASTQLATYMQCLHDATQNHAIQPSITVIVS